MVARTFTKEQMAEADRLDREKVQTLYTWMLYQDPQPKQAPAEPTDRWSHGPDD